MKKVILMMNLLAVMCCSAANADTPAATNPVIRIGGGEASCKEVFVPVQESFSEETGIGLSITPTNPVQGLIDLENGKVDVTASPLPLARLISGAAEKGIKVDPDQYVAREVGSSWTLIFLHPSNKVPALSKKQLQNIFTGRIKNWKAVGGPNKAIKVVWGQNTPGQNEIFSKAIFDGKAVTPQAIKATDYTDIRDKVSKNPGAIGIDPQGFASPVTLNPPAPPISSTIIAVTKGKPSQEVERLLRYIEAVSW